MEIDLSLLHSNTVEEIDISNTYKLDSNYYKDSDINDLLNLRNVGDLATLQSLLRNEIKMNNVVTIT